MEGTSLLYYNHITHDYSRGGINRVCDLIKAIQVPLLIYLATAASL